MGDLQDVPAALPINPPTPLPLPHLRRFTRFEHMWEDTAVLEGGGVIKITYGDKRTETMGAPGKFTSEEWLSYLKFIEDEPPEQDSETIAPEVGPEHREMWDREIAWCQQARIDAAKLLEAAKIREEGSQAILRQAQRDAEELINKAEEKCKSLLQEAITKAQRQLPSYELLRALMSAAKAQVPASPEAARQLDQWLTGTQHHQEFWNNTAAVDIRKAITDTRRRAMRDPAKTNEAIDSINEALNRMNQPNMALSQGTGGNVNMVGGLGALGAGAGVLASLTHNKKP